MNEPMDVLSKELAGGMSRRKALWRFVAGLGAVGVLTGRKAKADTGLVCEIWCNTQKTFFLNLCLQANASNIERQVICNAATSVFYSACIANSDKCPVGRCAEYEESSRDVGAAASVYKSFAEEEGDWVCVSVTGGGEVV
jgi:hypothetical protein